MIEGIRQAADEELQARIEASIRYRKPRVPVGLKLLATFLLVTTAGIVLWNYTGVNSDSDKAFLRLGWLKQRKAEERTIVPAPPVAKAPANKPSAEVVAAEEKTGDESVLPIDSGQTAEGKDTIYDAAGEIVVRKTSCSSPWISTYPVMSPGRTRQRSRIRRWNDSTLLRVS